MAHAELHDDRAVLVTFTAEEWEAFALMKVTPLKALENMVHNTARAVRHEHERGRGT